MPLEKVVLNDLCQDCNNYDSCLFNKKRDGMVFQCEEYDGHKETILDHVMNNPKDNQSERYSGLCSDCAHRNNCSLVSPNQIILNCEHYS